jgi:acyl-CoA synthetase (AMP-forming)/AMP-acid ligase II
MIFLSPYQEIQIPEVSLSSLILNRAKKFGSRTAFMDASTGAHMSYREFYDTVVSTARGLVRFGFRRGDVFAIYSPNCTDYAIAFHAVCLLGGIVTTANPLNTPQELAAQLKDSGAKFLLTIPTLLENATKAASGTDVRQIFVVGAVSTIPSFASIRIEDGSIPEVKISPGEDVVALPYSSGTTGFPKGVMLTHRNLVSNLLQIEASKVYHPEDVTLCVLPLFHIYGMVVIMNEALYLGCTNVIMQRFDLQQMLVAMQTHRVTLAPLVPPIVLALAKDPSVLKSDLSSLRMIFSAAAPLGAELIQECCRRIGCRLKQGYGMTEASPATHMSPDEPEKIVAGSVGVCVPNTECKIVDAQGNELGPNQEGEILIRGPQVMKGYLNKPKETRAAIDPEGWLRTGDIGIADRMGNFTIVDRVKELIKYKGYQVAPAEIEAVLLSHPMVADAAVIPAADTEAGEVPKAFVVLKSDIPLEEIQQYVASRVAPHKKIRKIERIDKIPKSPSGKILRRILVQQERQS